MSSFKTKTALGISPLVLPEDGGARTVAVAIAFDDVAAIVANDVVTLCEIPPGVRVVDYDLFVDDIDTGTTAVFDLGELDAPGTGIALAYETGLTTGQAGGVARATKVAHLTSNKANKRTLGMKFTGAQAGSLAGKKGLLLLDLMT